jgi:hypothetical protein
LLSDDEYSWTELDCCLDSLPPALRQAAPGPKPGCVGQAVRTFADQNAFTRDIFECVRNGGQSVQGLTAAMYSLREAQARRDGMDILSGFRLIAGVNHCLGDRDVLRSLPAFVFEDIVEPLRFMKFTSAEVDEIWSSHLFTYCRQNSRAESSVDLIPCLLELQL